MPRDEGPGFSKNSPENFFESDILEGVNFYEVFDGGDCLLQDVLHRRIDCCLKVDFLSVDSGAINILVSAVRRGIDQDYLKLDSFFAPVGNHKFSTHRKNPSISRNPEWASEVGVGVSNIKKIRNQIF